MHRCWPSAIGIAGCALFIFGVLFSLYMVPFLEEEHFNKQENLRNGTAAFNQFLHSSLYTTKFHVYFFNVVNPDAIIYEKAKPKVKEIGPYVYNVEKYKTIKKLDEKDGTVEFYETTYYYFNSVDSKNHLEDDVITFPNGILLSLLKVLTEQALLPREQINEIIESGTDLINLFVQAEVKDILFNGVTVQCSEKLRPVCAHLQLQYIQFLRQFETDIKFSFFNHINATLFGPFKMSMDPNSLQNLYYYKGKNRLKIWQAKGKCNDIMGSSIHRFPPMTYPASQIYIFFVDFCRSVPFVFDSKNPFYNIPTFTFTNSPKTFDEIKQNVCFCQKERFHRRSIACNVKGTMNLQSCHHFPTILSNPHFYMGDMTLVNYVDGLTDPEKNLHGSFIDIEPKSGIQLKSVIRFQYNIKLKSLEAVDNKTTINEGILPILWMEENVEAKPSLVDYFLGKIFYIKLLHLLRYLLIALGILIMLLSVVMLAYQEVQTTREIFKKREISALTVFNEKEELKTINVNLYPQVISRNVSDSFAKRVQ